MSLQIQINDQPLSVEKGTTVLQAARENGIYIPTLCDYPNLPSHGSCRMCIVDIQGRPNTPTACTTPVEEGMVVRTDTARVQALRMDLLQMLLSEHPCGCLFCPENSRCEECMVTLRKAGVTTGCRSCPKDGQCDLQTLTEKMGLKQLEYPVRYRMLPVDRRDPFFDMDYNLCILCGRCVRICEEHHFKDILTITNRGTHAVVGTAFQRTHLEAGCSFCGACIEACPTGALSEKTRKWDGRPEAETASTCPLCSIGCPISLLTKDEMVIGSLPDHEVNKTGLCVKGRFGITELVNHPSRLKRPQKVVEGSRLDTAWDDALTAAAEQITACQPGEFAMKISAQCSNESLYIAQKFARQLAKSELETRVSDRHKIMKEVLEQSQPLSVLEEVSTILAPGFDGQYAQSVVETELRRAKGRGARIITVHSKEHLLGLYADEWLRIEPTDEKVLLNKIHELAGMGKDLAILVGPAVLSDPGSADLLTTVLKLAQESGARMIALPEDGNLFAHLRLELPFSEPCEAGAELNQECKVLYLIGAAAPTFTDGKPFVIYQNIYPPMDISSADLLFPAAAFTEEDGTFLDYAGSTKPLRKALAAPQEALPSWVIICKLAQKLGLSGFEYESAAQIRQEIAQCLPENGAPGDSAASLLTIERAREHFYMGFPLQKWVEGLQWLYVDQEKDPQSVPAGVAHV